MGEATAPALAIQRTIGALVLLPPPPSLQAPVGRLLTDLHRVQQLQLEAGSQRGRHGGDYGLRGAISAAEQQAAMDSAAAGLPGCSPPRSVPASPPTTPQQR